MLQPTLHTSPILLLLLLLLATLTPPCTAGNERDWTNSKQADWPVYIIPTGKINGFYELECSDARNSPEARQPDSTLPAELVICETNCRCNAYGEFYLNPLEQGGCNHDIFLQRCFNYGCKCVWVQQNSEYNNDNPHRWRRDQLEVMPPRPKDPPKYTKESLKRREVVAE
ncbi:hypothetical protein ABW19_dt0208392 [Dactylella cylindrospora]|nr:hypothetical protein ABW19_dt0208392 [Dactylella cylindrospora]